MPYWLCAALLVQDMITCASRSRLILPSINHSNEPLAFFLFLNLLSTKKYVKKCPIYIFIIIGRN